MDILYLVFDGKLLLQGFDKMADAHEFIRACKLEDKQEMDYSHTYKLKESCYG